MPNLVVPQSNVLCCILVFSLLATSSCFASTLITPPSERITLYIPNNESSKTALNKITCAFSATGVGLDSVKLPWQRVVLYAENNIGQAFYPGENRIENIDQLIASDAVMHSKVYWLTRSAVELSAQQQKYEQGVAVTKASHARHWAKVQQQRLFETKDSNKVLELVASGRVTRGLLSQEEYRHALKTLALSSEDFNVSEAFEASQHVFFSKQFLAKQANYLRRFNEGLKMCKETKRVASAELKIE